MRRKLRSRRGVSILEMLAALLIVSMLTAGGVAATSAVMTNYNRMTEAANADILASTVIETISNEIRLGKGFTNSTDKKELNLEKSAYFGDDVTITLDANGRLIAKVKKSGGTTEEKQLLAERAYSEGYGEDGVLKLEDLNFTVDPVTHTDAAGNTTVVKTVVKFSFTVHSNYSEKLWSRTVNAAPIIE